MAKAIGVLMILSTVIISVCLKFKEYHACRAAAHMERVNRMERTRNEYAFRLIQADIRKWYSEKPQYKKDVKIVCKDPFIAGVFISGIKGGDV